MKCEEDGRMELISREKAIEYATQAHISGCVQQRIVDLLNSVPSIEDMTADYSAGFDKGYNKGYIDGCADGESNAKSMPKGKWLTKTDRVWVVCSNCGKAVGDLGWTYPFCPHCTAEMEGTEREE